MMRSTLVLTTIALLFNACAVTGVDLYILPERGYIFGGKRIASNDELATLIRQDSRQVKLHVCKGAMANRFTDTIVLVPEGRVSSTNVPLVDCIDPTREPLAVAAKDAWLAPLPSNDRSRWQAVPDHEFFEVPASRLSTAQFWLAQTTSSLQRPSVSEFFGRKDFQCRPGTELYLIRAAFRHGGTGRFGVGWNGKDVLVTHHSLGPGNHSHPSALIVCLPRAPDAVFAHVQSAL